MQQIMRFAAELHIEHASPELHDFQRVKKTGWPNLLKETVQFWLNIQSISEDGMPLYTSVVSF